MSYDTVGFWIKREDIPGGDTRMILRYLHWKKKEYVEIKGYSYIHFRDNSYDDYYYWRGTIGNYIVKIYENGISLEGSLSKYLTDNNFEPTTLEMIRKAVEKLENDLHINLKIATVTRLDIGFVIRTIYPPHDYYLCFGYKPGFDRWIVLNSLYYIIKRRKLIVYDKILEATENGGNIPEKFKEGNHIKIELSFLEDLKEQLGTDVTGATLYDRDFYNKVVKYLYNEFHNINKVNKMNTILEGTKTVDEAKDILFARLLLEAEPNTITEYLIECKTANIFRNRTDNNRLKKKLYGVIAAPAAQKSEMVLELETAFDKVIKVYTEI